MADNNTGNVVTRGAPGYHLEALPDGQQVLVNDRTGMVAITDPYTGRITSEVPRSQVPGLGVQKTGAQAPGVGVPQAQGPQQQSTSGTQYPLGVTNTQPPYNPGVYQPGGAQPATATPPPAAAAASGGATYPMGVTNPGGATSGTAFPPGTPSGGGPSGVTPRAAGQLSGNVSPRTAPATATAASGPTGQQRPAPGAAGYDLWAMNDMLRQNGMDGWQVTGVVPIQQVSTIKNPNADIDPDNPTIPQPKNEYVINAMDPSTGDVRTLTFARVWQGANGGYTDKDPGDGSGYGYQLGDVKSQIKADGNAKGYTGQMTIGDTLWGTNARTGAFEPVAGAPKIPKAWSDVKQITDKDGNQVWYGVDPVDQQLKPVPGMESLTIPKQATAWGDPQLIDDGTGTGNKVWYGVDPTDKVMKPMPNMPKVLAGPKGPASINQNGQIFIQKSDGSYAPAEGVPDPNPPKGQTQLILGPDGFIYQQISRGNGQGFDPDNTFTPIAYTDAAKQSQANTASLHKAGEPGTKVIDGKVYHVIYRGGSNDNYDVDTSQPATPMPGAGSPTSIVTGTDAPKIAQRMPDGSVQWIDNQNYAPTDPAQKVAQLSQQANAKLAEIQAKIGTTYTGADAQQKAQSEFDQWWDQNVEPAKQEIQIAQQTAQQTQARSNLQIAQATVSPVLQAETNANEIQVGPGFGDLMGKIASATGQGKFVGPISGDEINNALTYQRPDYAAQAQAITAQALAHISPTAASIAGGGTPGALQQPPDVTGALNRTNYQYGAGPGGTVQMPQQTGAPGAAMPYMATAQPPAGQAPPMGGGAPAATAPTPDIPQQSYVNPQALQTMDDQQQGQLQLTQQMLQDRAAQIAANQRLIPTSWNAWGQYKPAF